MASNLRMCPHCRAFVLSSERVCTECREPMGRPYAKRFAEGAAMAGFVPPTHFTTLIILMINGGLFAATLLMSLKGGDSWDIDIGVLYVFGAKYPRAIWGGQWWRLVTAGFLHGGIFHLLMNSWALYDLGAHVEEAYGTSRMLVFYILSSVAGFVASTFWSAALSMGASAAIFGLIGTMIAYGYRNRTALGAAVKAMYARWAIYGLLFGLLPFFQMDNAAHLGGLAAGFVLAYAAGVPTARSRQGLWKAAAAVVVFAVVVSFLFVWRGFPAGS